METPGAPGPQGRPHCSRHPEVPAVARCVNCGRFACGACRVLLGNRNYCTGCAGPYATAGPPPFAPPVRVKPARPVVFPGAPWGVGEALIIFFLSMAIAVSVSIFIYILLSRFASTTTTYVLLVFFSSCILYAFMMAGTFYSVKYRHHSTPTALGLRLEGFGKSLAWGVGLGIPLFVAAIGLAYLSQKVISPTRVDYVSQALDRMSTNGFDTALVVILFFTLLVLAPVCEEIFFRGYLYPALRNRMNMQPAMIVNSLIFAAVHFELVGFLSRLVLGYGLCYLYEKNRTITAPIACHALYNGLIVVLSGLL